MSALVVVVGLLITAMGLLGIAAPGRLIHFVKSVQTPAGLYSAAGLRVLLGVALWFAAPASRAPDALRILGVVVLVAGIVTPFFGLKRSRKLLEWWWSRGAGFIRVWACFAAAFGLLLIYSVTP
jgi:hypothetical protein